MKKLLRKRIIRARVKKVMQTTLKEYKDRIKSISLFGSYARGEQTENSDVDLLVEFTPNAKISLFDLGGMFSEFEKAMGRKVDVAPRDSLREHVKDNILADAILIYRQKNDSESKKPAITLQ